MLLSFEVVTGLRLVLQGQTFRGRFPSLRNVWPQETSQKNGWYSGYPYNILSVLLVTFITYECMTCFTQDLQCLQLNSLSSFSCESTISYP